MIDQPSLLDDPVGALCAPADLHDPSHQRALTPRLSSVPGMLPVTPYPGGVPHVAGSDTSIAAAELMTHRTGSMQAEILRLLRVHDFAGLTCDMVEVLTGWSHQSASARIRELVLAELVVDSGLRRKGRSGRSGRVYRLAP